MPLLPAESSRGKPPTPGYVFVSGRMQAAHPDSGYRYDTSKTVIAKVDDFSTVRFEKNNYSVPTRYLRKEVTVKGYANSISILNAARS